MKSRVLTMVGLFLSVLPSWSSEKYLSIAPPTKNFGVVRPGTINKAIFTIANPHKTKWEFYPLPGDCDCVEFHIQKTTLLPGKSAALTVTYKPTDGSGKQQKSFTLVSVDPTGKKNERTVFLFSEVKPYHQFVPEKMEFGSLEEGTKKERLIQWTIDPEIQKNWTPQIEPVNIEGFKLMLIAGKEKGSYTVVGNVDGTSPRGEYKGEIRLISGKTATKQRNVEIPFSFTIYNPYYVSVSEVEISQWLETRSDNEKSFEIVHRRNEVFKVEGVEGLPSWVNCKISKQKIGGYLVRLRIDKKKMENSMEKGIGEVHILLREGKAKKIVLLSKNEGE